MHVRIAWEIYHHQAKQNPEKASSAAGVKPESMLRPHMYPPPSPSVRPHDMPPTPSGFPSAPPQSLQGRPFDPISANFLSSPSSHLGNNNNAIMFHQPNMHQRDFLIAGVNPFGRYASPFASPFSGLTPYARDMPLGGPLHDPWRR